MSFPFPSPFLSESHTLTIHERQLQPLTFGAFHTLLVKTRVEITNRQLISQSFVVAAADKEGKTGPVVHTSHFSGMPNGKEVTETVIAVLKIGWEEQRRIVETESFVLALD